MYGMTSIILFGLYLAVSMFAIYMTYQEHRINGHRGLVMIWVSYLLRLAWPLAAAAVFAAALWRPADLAPAKRG